MFRHSMFGVFEVQYFGVSSKTSTYVLAIFMTHILNIREYMCVCVTVMCDVVISD